MSATFRLLRPEDHAQWLPLWRGYLAFYKAEVADAITALTWGRIHDTSEAMFAMGAVVDDHMVGFAIALTHRSTWLTGWDCYLEDLFVDAAARGQQAGRGLIEAIAAEAAARGAERLHWKTNHDNETARRLYDSLARHDGCVTYKRDLKAPPAKA